MGCLQLPTDYYFSKSDCRSFFDFFGVFSEKEVPRFFLTMHPVDADGNITSDGQYNYKWNAENRLIKIESLTESTEDTEKKKIEFVYDYQGRRTIKRVYNWDTNTNAYNTTPAKTIIFIYDGWNEIARLKNGSLTKTYTWGEDLSGSLQGAGGVGGLLAVTDKTLPTVDLSAITLPSYDGNGNIMSYVKASDGVEVASYEYSPFGRTITQSGSDADSFAT